jgi:hypothetical protein
VEPLAGEAGEAVIPAARLTRAFRPFGARHAIRMTLAVTVLWLLPGCGVDMQDGAGPRVPIPDVLGLVRRAGTPASGLQVELRTDGGQEVASMATDRSGGYGFDVPGSGAWEIKVSSGRSDDFDSVTRGFQFQDPGPLSLPAVDVYAYGAAVLEPASDTSVVAPSPAQPLIFRWIRPALSGVAARVQLYDSAGAAVWSSSSLETDQIPWNGIGNQGSYQGQAVTAGQYSWRVKFVLPDTSQARSATRKLTLT